MGVTDTAARSSPISTVTLATTTSTRAMGRPLGARGRGLRGRSGGAPIGHGRGRKEFQFESALTYDAEGVAVHEQLTVEERAQDGTAGNFLRRAQGERRVRLQAGALLATAPSILDRWIGAQQKSE